MILKGAQHEVRSTLDEGNIVAKSRVLLTCNAPHLVPGSIILQPRPGKKPLPFELLFLGGVRRPAPLNTTGANAICGAPWMHAEMTLVTFHIERGHFLSTGTAGAHKAVHV